MHTIYLIAIVAEAISGAIMGMKRKMDLFGIGVVGTVTALGGGSVRDVLLGTRPLAWIAHPEYLMLTLVAALCTPLFARHLHHLRAVFLAVDALGLVAFTIIGCKVALAGQFPLAIAVMAGLITGVCGGLLRDIICNEIPLVLRRELYACVALLTAVLYLGLLELRMAPASATGVALGCGFALRLLAIRFHWGLPVIRADNLRGFDEPDRD
ncbi:trimeric intracellular cation channel family protein [Paraburkholderia caffeinilytica]|uniref:trimeric intracellular cation channel family protein n=1 Tax=Paraburkholderia caffeinilytica TaxID=1761016 RepID=UPI003DA14D82